MNVKYIIYPRYYNNIPLFNEKLTVTRISDGIVASTNKVLLTPHPSEDSLVLDISSMQTGSYLFKFDNPLLYELDSQDYSHYNEPDNLSSDQVIDTQRLLYKGELSNLIEISHPVTIGHTNYMVMLSTGESDIISQELITKNFEYPIEIHPREDKVIIKNLIANYYTSLEVRIFYRSNILL